MTDDIIESYFDFLVIEKLLTDYNLTVTIIPKNGCFGNDASFEDINKSISPELNKFKKEKRVKVSKKGPLMAAANLRKLSEEHFLQF